MASLKQINFSFIQTTPMEEIIPSLQFPAVGHALIGALLSRHKLFDFAYDEICRAPKDGTAQLWLAMLVLYRQDFDKARTYFQQVPQNHPCHEEMPRAFSLIDKTEQISAQKTAKDNNSEEVIQLCKLRITSYELRIVKSSCPLDLRNPKCKVYFSKLLKKRVATVLLVFI